MQDESQNLQPRTPVAFDEDDDAGFDDAEDVGDVEEIFVSHRSLNYACTHLITMHSPRKLTKGTCRHWMPYFPQAQESAKHSPISSSPSWIAGRQRKVA